MVLCCFHFFLTKSGNDEFSFFPPFLSKTHMSCSFFVATTDHFRGKLSCGRAAAEPLDGGRRPEGPRARWVALGRTKGKHHQEARYCAVSLLCWEEETGRYIFEPQQEKEEF